jgi:hypothetical protein
LKSKLSIFLKGIVLSLYNLHFNQSNLEKENRLEKNYFDEEKLLVRSIFILECEAENSVGSKGRTL